MQAIELLDFCVKNSRQTQKNISPKLNKFWLNSYFFVKQKNTMVKGRFLNVMLRF